VTRGASLSLKSWTKRLSTGPSSLRAGAWASRRRTWSAQHPGRRGRRGLPSAGPRVPWRHRAPRCPSRRQGVGDDAMTVGGTTYENAAGQQPCPYMIVP